MPGADPGRPSEVLSPLEPGERPASGERTLDRPRSQGTHRSSWPPKVPSFIAIKRVGGSQNSGQEIMLKARSSSVSRE